MSVQVISMNIISPSVPIGAEGIHILRPREAAPGRLLDELVLRHLHNCSMWNDDYQPDEHDLALA